MSPFEKMLMKKKEQGKVLSPSHAQAKSSILDELMDDMGGMDAGKLKGLKKVTVASNDPKGLEMGLAKAKEMVSKDPSEEGESVEEESAESPEMEASEDESSEMHEEDPEVLKAKIAELEAKLKKHNVE